MTCLGKTVGVLGGMGPYATSAFFHSLLKLTPAKKDWDHLRVIVDNNPHIPSRTRHLLYGEESPFEGMLETCLRLERYPVDLIALPCNSAAVFVPQLQKCLRVPLLNILQITANALAAQYPAVKRVAVLGGFVTYKTQSYKNFLSANGIELVEHSTQDQEQVQQLIEQLKLGRPGEDAIVGMRSLVARLRRDFDAQGVILACTEFSCLPCLGLDIPVVDSSFELARQTVKVAKQ